MSVTEIFAPGAILANGAVVLKQKSNIVLCFLPHNDVTPFATWVVKGDDTYHGDYCRDLDEAISSIVRRAK